MEFHREFFMEIHGIPWRFFTRDGRLFSRIASLISLCAEMKILDYIYTSTFNFVREYKLGIFRLRLKVS